MGVEEVFVYCGSHTQLLEEYIQSSRWHAPTSPFSKVELIRSTSKTVGDAMRHLDSLHLLVNDFIVVYGDVVSNLSLEGALAAHRARRAADKNAMMTMVLREVGPHHRTKNQVASPAFVIDPTKQRCLHYEEIQPRASDRFVTVDPEIMTDHGEIEVRTDMIDCGIDICTPEVLALWSDNFDFETPRKGFLYSVLKDYELNGKTIHTHIVSDDYAARVNDLHSYDSITKDMLSRWTYPLCPDSNLMPDQTYTMVKGNIYKEQGVILARSSVINRRTVIGRDTSIGEGTVVSNSVIGRRCNIGRNVRIEGSYIWDDAAIADGAVVTSAIIANEAHLGRNCKVEPGALISYQVRIGDGITVKGPSRVTRMQRAPEMYTEPVVGDPDPRVVGEKGDGFEFYDEDEDEEDIAERALRNLVVLEELDDGQDSISDLSSEDGSDDEFTHSRDRADDSRTSSFVSTGSDDSQDPGHAKNFHHDAVNSIFDSLVKSDDYANMQLELTALRMSTNASEHQVRRAMVHATMRYISQLLEEGTKPKDAANSLFSRYKSLVSRTMFDKQRANKDDQVDFLLLLQQDLASRTQGETIILFVCNALFTNDIIEEEGFEQWWEDSRSSEGDELVRVRKGVQQFIDALLAEDDSEEDESEEDDEDEE